MRDLADDLYSVAEDANAGQKTLIGPVPHIDFNGGVAVPEKRKSRGKKKPNGDDSDGEAEEGPKIKLQKDGKGRWIAPDPDLPSSRDLCRAFVKRELLWQIGQNKLLFVYTV